MSISTKRNNYMGPNENMDASKGRYSTGPDGSAIPLKVNHLPPVNSSSNRRQSGFSSSSNRHQGRMASSVSNSKMLVNG